MKLLAIIALASGVAHADTPRLLRDGRPAAGNTMGKRPAHVEVAPVAPTLDEEIAVIALRDRLFALFALLASGERPAVPRTINGRPACGNVSARALPREDC